MNPLIGYMQSNHSLFCSPLKIGAIYKIINNPLLTGVRYFSVEIHKNLDIIVDIDPLKSPQEPIYVIEALEYKETRINTMRVSRFKVLHKYNFNNAIIHQNYRTLTYDEQGRLSTVQERGGFKNQKQFFYDGNNKLHCIIERDKDRIISQTIMEYKDDIMHKKTVFMNGSQEVHYGFEIEK